MCRNDPGLKLKRHADDPIMVFCAILFALNVLLAIVGFIPRQDKRFEDGRLIYLS